MKNSQNIVRKIFQPNICKKCDTYWQKTCCWCLGKLKFGTQVNQFVPKKKHQNNFFPRCKHHCQNWIWNIQIFYVICFHRVKYLLLFWGWCSTRPHNIIHILPADCLNCYWLFLNLAAAVDCVQLIPKYHSKVKLRSWQSPNISVWNN